MSSEDNYISSKLRKPQSIAELPRESSEQFDIYGSDVNKRGNMALIENDVLAYTAGNAIIFMNIWSLSTEFVLGIEDCGVSCIAIHPSRLFSSRPLASF